MSRFVEVVVRHRRLAVASLAAEVTAALALLFSGMGGAVVLPPLPTNDLRTCWR
jgi:hypothetical protein